MFLDSIFGRINALLVQAPDTIWLAWHACHRKHDFWLNLDMRRSSKQSRKIHRRKLQTLLLRGCIVFLRYTASININVQQFPSIVSCQYIFSDEFEIFFRIKTYESIISECQGLVTYAENPVGILMHLISHDKLGMNSTDTPDASVAANVLNRFISRANKSIKSLGKKVVNSS